MQDKDKSFTYKMPLIFTNRIHDALIQHCRTHNIDERSILAAHHRYLGDELLKWAESTDGEELYFKALQEYRRAIDIWPNQEFQQARNQVYFILSTNQLIKAYLSEQTVDYFMINEPPHIPEGIAEIAAVEGIRERIRYLMEKGKLAPDVGEDLLALGSKKINHSLKYSQ